MNLIYIIFYVYITQQIFTYIKSKKKTYIQISKFMEYFYFYKTKTLVSLFILYRIKQLMEVLYHKNKNKNEKY